MAEKVSRACYLKKVSITLSPNSTAQRKTLCEYLKDIFITFHRANERKLQLSDDEDRYRVMNDWKFLGENQDTCAASIFAFTMNANHNAAVLNSDDDSFPIEVLAPQRDPEHHQEFIEGLAWFATTKDHIAIMAAQTVSFSAIEEYLSWIIGKLLDEAVIIRFTEPQHVNFRDCTMDNVSRISLRSGIDVNESLGRDGSRRSFKASGRGWKILEAVFGAFDKRPPRLPLDSEDALEQVDIDVIIFAAGYVLLGFSITMAISFILSYFSATDESNKARLEEMNYAYKKEHPELFRNDTKLVKEQLGGFGSGYNSPLMPAKTV